jgi:pimeloyl-ACP methyl ester carboxylesterase
LTKQERFFRVSRFAEPKSLATSGTKENPMAEAENKVPNHFLVIVPGYMGTKLRHRDTREIVWVNTSNIPWLPIYWKGWLTNLLTTLEYPNEKLEPWGIMDDVVFIPPWAKLENYERLVRKLQSLGYKVDMAQCFGYEGDQPPFDESKLNVYAFAYDWRQDNRLSARQLGAAIDRWRKYHPGAQVWIIAHSNGGLVARWYIEQEGGKEHVQRLFLMGSPWDGTPKALYMAFNGVDTLFRRKFNAFNIPQLTRKLVRTFPSIYQLIPSQGSFLRDNVDNKSVNPFTDGVWLDAAQTAMLQDGLAFSQKLGTNMSVETICFFGTRHLTQTSGRVVFHAANTWKEIQWDEPADAGDGTIPIPSAVHPRATEKLPYPVSHGDIYVNEAVLEKLRYELIDKYRLTQRAVVITNNLKIVFEQESNQQQDGHQDFYSPGENINLWATVHKLPPNYSRSAENSSTDQSLTLNEENLEPVSDATIKVRLLWRRLLPGVEVTDEIKTPPSNLPETYLKKPRAAPWRYEGKIEAPQREGYYELRAEVSVARLPRISLSELIAIEAEPDALEELGDEVKESRDEG